MNVRGVSLLTLALAAGAVTCRRPDVVQPTCDPPRSAMVAPAADTLVVGDTARLRAVAVGCMLESHALRWSVRDGSVATIDSATDTSAVVTATGVGQTVIIVTAVADTTVKAASLLTVVSVAASISPVAPTWAGAASLRAPAPGPAPPRW